MQHYILRCKHCQKEYTYCTYGNGPEYGTEEGCSREYCAECQKAIDTALKPISIKMEPRYMDIDEPLLLPLFEEIKTNYEKERSNGLNFPCFVNLSDMYGAKYDNRENYSHKGIKYKVEWDDKSPDKKHISIMMEYDVINQKFTGNVWRYDNYKDSYSFTKCEKKIFCEKMSEAFERSKTDMISPKSMEAPSGLLSYMDFPYWEVKSDYIKEEYKPKHELRTYDLVKKGSAVKGWLKYGTYQCESKVKNNINVNDLIDFIEYRCYFEKYDDEKYEYLVKIECV